jgi:hypothetical protein
MRTRKKRLSAERSGTVLSYVPFREEVLSYTKKVTFAAVVRVREMPCEAKTPDFVHA